MKYAEHAWCQCDFLFHFIDLKQKYRSYGGSSEITLKMSVHHVVLFLLSVHIYWMQQIGNQPF